MTIRLKVKIKSLAHEAMVIRKEERKALQSARWNEGYRLTEVLIKHTNKKRKVWVKTEKSTNEQAVEAPKLRNLFWELRDHRVKEVRPEARLSHLAYAYLRGKTYAETEDCSSDKFKKLLHKKLDLVSMINRFNDVQGTPLVTEKDVDKWLAGRS